MRFGTQAWHLTTARAGRHLPRDVGTSPPKIGALIHGHPAGGGTVAGVTVATLEWRDERRDMAVKTEKEIRKKSQERRRLSLLVNGQVHELKVGTEPDQVDPATRWPIRSGKRWVLPARRYPATTAHVDAAPC